MVWSAEEMEKSYHSSKVCNDFGRNNNNGLSFEPEPIRCGIIVCLWLIAEKYPCYLGSCKSKKHDLRRSAYENKHYDYAA